MAQNTQSGASAGGSTVDSMYSLRHPAQSRSRLIERRTGGRQPWILLVAAASTWPSPWPRSSQARQLFGLQALDEGVDADAPLGPLRTSSVHTDRSLVHVVVTDHEHVGQLLQLGLADAGAERLVGLGVVGAET